MRGSVSEIILQANLRVDLINANINTGGPPLRPDV
jgi:hypothetical protein